MQDENQPHTDFSDGVEQHFDGDIEQQVALTHAQAEAIRRKKEKASKLSAFLITVVIHVAAILILTLIVIPAMQVDIPPIQARTAPPTEGTVDTAIRQQQVRTRPTTPSMSAQTITTTAPSASAFAPEVVFETETLELGMSVSLGLGLGEDGHDFGGLPGALQGRCTPQERLKRLREGGGMPGIENAVQRSLQWFQANQREDGSWGNRAYAAMTGLALLAYFGHCETPQSSQYGDTVTRGMTYLINLSQRNNGRLAVVGGNHWVYEHVKATYALCEALTFVRELHMDFPGLEEAAFKAVDLMIEGQHPSGFWCYQYNKGPNRQGDLSITAWHMQALKAAEYAGYDAEKIAPAIEKAIERVKWVQNEDGTFGYTGPSRSGNQRLVGAGVLSLQLWGLDQSDRSVRNGLRWINRNMRPVYSSNNTNLYAWYYCTLALFQRGSTYWSRWQDPMSRELMAAQNEDGSWRQEGGFATMGIQSTQSAGVDAPIYRNALNVLSLQAYYRFLPGTGDVR